MSIFTLNILGFHISPTYYGLMYGLSFLLGYLFLKKYGKIEAKYLDDLLLYIFFGVILGGRLGYVIFYDLAYYLQNIADIIKVWNGGMSFHGGALGVIASMYLFAKKYSLSFLRLSDHITLVIPIGLFFGRIGNYINGELLGFSGYTGPFAVYKGGTGFFPSPLLEAFLEGLILFLILLWIYKRQKFDGQIAALFLIGYGVFRVFVELFFRQPDEHIGLLFGLISTGTFLSIPMILIGGFFYWRLRLTNKPKNT